LARAEPEIWFSRGLLPANTLQGIPGVESRKSRFPLDPVENTIRAKAAIPLQARLILSDVNGKPDGFAPHGLATVLSVRQLFQSAGGASANCDVVARLVED
jgi:hypothetical protein